MIQLFNILFRMMDDLPGSKESDEPAAGAKDQPLLFQEQEKQSDQSGKRCKAGGDQQSGQHAEPEKK